ncbi:hypothetical protein [Undibacterium sp. CCC3.4]|uniref:hypothetical protein n=1 Tax=Undibacterium sp. CCC3.4 TaxID=3048609 RepID=UPI002AC8EFEB|nr:hypothetical protein [Undibacterium sp. CCC3.4]WPX44327.1 hypothetical protein RHM61_03600 [Undibacterium sp. CCC3.4]
MNKKTKWSILCILLIIAIINMVAKYKFMSNANLLFMMVGYFWAIYNFYACLFGQMLLASPSIDARPKPERRYLRIIFSVFLMGGFFISLFFV